MLKAVRRNEREENARRNSIELTETSKIIDREHQEISGNIRIIQTIFRISICSRSFVCIACYIVSKMYMIETILTIMLLIPLYWICTMLCSQTKLALMYQQSVSVWRFTLVLVFFVFSVRYFFEIYNFCCV